MNRRRLSPQSRRAGWQLVELVAVLSLTAVLLTASVQLLALVMGMESRVGAGLQNGLALSQFSRQFRRDCHQAKRVETTGTGLSLSLADGSNVTYESQESSVLREQRTLPDAPPLSNIYRLASGRIRFEHDAAAHLLRAVHQNSSEYESTTPAAQSIEADIGLLSAATSSAASSNGEAGP